MSGSVELIEGRFYWVRDAYDAEPWLVARWECSSFWSGDRQLTACAIVGPLEPPSATERSGVSGAIEAPLGAPDVSDEVPGSSK